MTVTKQFTKEEAAEVAQKLGKEIPDLLLIQYSSQLLS